MKKEEKQKLHEDDQFVKFVSTTWDKIRSRRRLAIIALVVVVGALAIIALSAGLSEEFEDKARSVADRAETVEEMEKAADKYPKAPDLLVRLGAAYVQRGKDGDLKRAESVLERARACARDSFQRPLIALALAKVKMDQKDCENALKLFADAAAAKETQMLIQDEANWYAGRCLELLNRPREAGERYGLIGGGGMWDALARYRETKLRQESLD